MVDYIKKQKLNEIDRIYHHVIMGVGYAVQFTFLCYFSSNRIFHLLAFAT